MAATVQSVRDLDLGGAFSALSPAQIQTYLDLAARMIDANVWGDCYDQAHALLGAHLVQEATQAATGAVGPVTSASAGGLSVSYGGGGISGAVSGTRFAEMLNDLWDVCGGAASGVIASRHSCGEGTYPMFFAAAGSTSAPSSGGFTDAYKTKLDGIADGATANASDADLRDRTTHTGTQTAATISDFAASVDARLTGFAPLASPTFTGTVTAPNPPSGSSDQTVATTSWVRSVATGGGGSVDLTPLTNRVTALEASQTTQDTAITARAPLASPALTGVPTAPTASTGTSTTQVATTAFVAAAIPAPVDLAPLTGRVSTAETKIAALETSQGTQDTAIAAKANIASPTLTGAPKAPTPAGTATGTEIATAAFVLSKIPAATDLGPLTARVGALETSQGTQDTAITAAQAKSDANETALTVKAPLASPTFTGVPKGPTATPGENTTQLATTAFVTNAVAGVSGGGAPLNSPVFTGDPRAPTPPTGDNDTSIATTAFVKAQGYAPLQSPQFQGTPQAPTPAPTDSSNKIVTTAWVQNRAYATVNSPAFTGTPTVPTPAPNDNSSQIATTSFVANKDYAPRASPTLLGVPTAPTATAGTNTNQIATCEFVQAALPDTAAIATNTAAITALEASQTTQDTAISANTAKVSNATHTGDVTGSTALTISDGAVTLPKMAPLAADKLLGRLMSAGEPQALSIGAGLYGTANSLVAQRRHSTRSTARWRVNTDNRWVATSLSFGLGGDSMTISAGTGADPELEWDSYSEPIPAGTVITAWDLMMLRGDAAITAAKYRLYFQHGTPGSWVGTAQTTRTLIKDTGDVTFSNTGWYSSKNTMNFVAPADGFIIIYMKPTSAVTANQYVYCGQRIDMVLPA